MDNWLAVTVAARVAAPLYVKGAARPVPEDTSDLTFVTRSRAAAGPEPEEPRRRWLSCAGSLVPSGAAGRVLVGLVLLGVVLRSVIEVSWWPVATTLQDGYQTAAATNPFLDPLHPAGYSLILGGIGSLTREIAVTVLLQHLVGVVSALLLYAATRRVTGSRWAGLLPAAVMLLDGDVIFLEHSIMSETWMMLAVAAGLYAAVRACERTSGRWWLWPVLTGAAMAVAVMIRTNSLPVVVVAAVAVLVSRPGSAWRWRERMRAAGALCLTAAILLLAFAGTSALAGGRFQVNPSSGWYLYMRVAQFADCSRFTPPAGTSALCESTPLSERLSGQDYQDSPESPAVHTFGAYGSHDGQVGAWAQCALLAQPGDFLNTAWTYLRGYYVPGSLPARLRTVSSTGLDPQLDFSLPLLAADPSTKPDTPLYTHQIADYLATGYTAALRRYYGNFGTHMDPSGLRFLRDWQLVFRFGATVLFITTILIAIGLGTGPRRSRVGVLLFGIGGLSLLLGPVLIGEYAGRYTVPSAGPMMAATAITLTEIWRAIRTRTMPGLAPHGRY
jgi:4-amino-4-deoxy-L-arabinose transferase-like glycosyltransferase